MFSISFITPHTPSLFLLLLLPKAGSSFDVSPFYEPVSSQKLAV